MSDTLVVLKFSACTKMGLEYGKGHVVVLHSEGTLVDKDEILAELPKVTELEIVTEGHQWHGNKKKL